MIVFLFPLNVWSQWKTVDFINEFDEIEVGATSESVKSTVPIESSSDEIRTRVFVNCDRVWLRFSELPKMSWGDAENRRYVLYNILVRFDEESSKRMVLRQNESENKNLSFDFTDRTNVIDFLKSLSSNISITISIPWEGSRNGVFKWSLGGADKAILTSCDL